MSKGGGEVMGISIVFAIMACFVWGLIFVVPAWMTDFSSIEVALGRYCVYGSISLLIYLKMALVEKLHYARAIWLKALFFSLICTFVYYVALVLGVRYASPAICAMVIGICPIAIAVMGNWKQKETRFRDLLFPSLLIVTGLVIINVPHLQTTQTPVTYLLGLAFSLVALLAWSWYVVANARFLKSHPNVLPNEWATLVGVSTLVWVFLFGLGMVVFAPDTQSLQKFVTPGQVLTQYWLGSLTLGVLCSWLGAYLWNKASLYLPVSLAGQLTVFETIFGVIFAYLLAGTWPSRLEILGMGILLFAVLYAIRHFSRSLTKTLGPH